MKNTPTYLRGRVWGAYASRVWPSARHLCRIEPGTESSSVRSGIFWNKQTMSHLTELLFHPSHDTTSMSALTSFRAGHLHLVKKSVSIRVNPWLRSARHSSPKSLRVSHCPPTTLVMPAPNLSTFPSAKIKRAKLIIHQCSRALDGNPLQPVLKVNQGNQVQKYFENFSRHFDWKTLANQAKTVKKTPSKCAKNRVF